MNIKEIATERVALLAKTDEYDKGLRITSSSIYQVKRKQA
jgi:hypothetical protein